MPPPEPDLDRLTNLLSLCLGRIEEQAFRLQDDTGQHEAELAGSVFDDETGMLQDLVGMTEHPPRFAAPVASRGRSYEEAAREWTARVAARQIGGPAYSMRSGEARKLADEGCPSVARQQRA